ncbi:hypothetical protein LIER_34829 [Lithospermum erythrorhizon]|uniref:MtN19-like protein n=1 Tax=Lithospermum erythrorhizon TaxID=34254 RepID=A0AAV3S4K8_LITER
MGRERMINGSGCSLVLVVLILSFVFVESIQVDTKYENGVKTDVFLSPKVELEPGLVSNKNYYNIDFPRGHIGIKQFYAELVDEAGNSVPLHETYIHHYVIVKYYQRKGVEEINNRRDLGFEEPDVIVGKNSGICEQGLVQYFGLGSETRRTDSHIPDPYGIEVGNPVDTPLGYEERWMLIVHAIDTRYVVDKIQCTECRCDLYNVTVNEYGKPLTDGYIGGLACCYDGMRCRLKEGVHGGKRNLFLRYTVKYLEWDASILPVKIYIIDVTDTWKWLNQSAGLSSSHHCLVEYSVQPSSAENDLGCVDAKKLSVRFPVSGDVIYSVGHQHAAGHGLTLSHEDGREICSSIPIYGEGEEAGNEAGYVVGMSSCYPQPGSVKIAEGEMLTLFSNYSCTKGHPGVMGFVYLLIADSNSQSGSLAVHEKVLVPKAILGVAIFGIAVMVVIAVVIQKRNKAEDGYESIHM